MSYDFLMGEWVLLAIRTDPRHPFHEAANGIIFEVNRDKESKVVMVFEYPDDGYRSSATDPFISNCSMWEICEPTYVRVPVLISPLAYEHGKAEGIEMRDRRNGKVILEVGTKNSDDYYPYFCAEWMPHNIAENEK